MIDLRCVVEAMAVERSAEAFIDALDSDLRPIAGRLRNLIFEVIPDAIEIVDEPAKLIGYGFDLGYKGLVCGIAPQRGYVNLMLSRGAKLPDPDGLLEGTGKRARHVKMRTVEQAEAPAVRVLIEECAGIVRKSIDSKN